MTDRTEQELSAHDAARIIYNTPQPTAQQVGQVRMRLLRGHLKPGPGGAATTTSKAVAEFMTSAAQAHLQQGKKKKKPESGNQLSGLYRELMRDYFLAIVVRRKFGNRSDVFRHAVVVGQIVTILLAIVGTYWVVKSAIEREPPEYKLVRAFIKQQGWADIHQYSSTPSPAGTIVRVQYSYRSGSAKKLVRTERTYLVTGQQVQEFTSGDDG